VIPRHNMMWKKQAGQCLSNPALCWTLLWTVCGTNYAIDLFLFSAGMELNWSDFTKLAAMGQIFFTFLSPAKGTLPSTRPPKCLGNLGVGAAPATFPTEKQMPGWIQSSLGWHSDGHIFCGNPNGSVFDKPFGGGDVIGCGVKLDDGQASWTRNGHW